MLLQHCRLLHCRDVSAVRIAEASGLVTGEREAEKTARHARWKNIYTVKDFKPKYYPKGRVTP